MSPLNRLTDRYHNDAAFHVVVDALSNAIETLQLSPTEVREAAMLACYLSECRRPGFIGVTSELGREPPKGGPYR